MKKSRSDYKIRPYRNNLNPERQLWQIYIGKDELITTCRSLEQAEQTVAALNADPWALSRGNTQADRANMKAAPRS